MEAATAALTAPIRKSPDPYCEIPARIQPGKPIPLSNGVLKRHHHHQQSPPPAAVVYKECLKNHAASIGGHALDGCGEFMPSPATTAADPTSLKCAVCGCHRNFHRRDPDDSPHLPPPTATTAHAIEYHPHHRHHPPPRSPSSASPPPISSSYYPHSAPHMLLALSSPADGHPHPPPANGGSRKRFRTKFTQKQKDRMLEFAEQVGWKVQKRDEDVIQEFCHEVGVDRNVLKVWMHNNKNTFCKNKAAAFNGGSINLDDDQLQQGGSGQMGANGSSSSS